VSSRYVRLETDYRLGSYALEMTKKQKLLQRLLSGSKNIRFDEFVTVILAFGFTRVRISGSHHIYEHPNVPQPISIQPDQNNQAKAYQVRQFTKLIEKYSLKLIIDEVDKGDNDS
jgi:predicted RNA binding protein YcfA (HicA-like mRNA interferase family)